MSSLIPLKLLTEKVKKMDPKSSAFVIGIVGAAVTLSAYSQTLVSPTQCIGVGLFVLMFGLLVREGFISL